MILHARCLWEAIYIDRAWDSILSTFSSALCICLRNLTTSPHSVPPPLRPTSHRGLSNGPRRFFTSSSRAASKFAFCCCAASAARRSASSSFRRSSSESASAALRLLSASRCCASTSSRPCSCTQGHQATRPRPTPRPTAVLGELLGGHLRHQLLPHLLRLGLRQLLGHLGALAAALHAPQLRDPLLLHRLRIRGLPLGGGQHLTPWSWQRPMPWSLSGPIGLHLATISLRGAAERGDSRPLCVSSP